MRDFTSVACISVAVFFSSLSYAWAEPVEACGCESVHASIREVVQEHLEELEAGKIVEVEDVPDFSDYFAEAAFDGGQAYLYVFLTDASQERAWVCARNHEQQDSFPKTPIDSVTVLGRKGDEVSYRTDTETFIGVQTQHTLSKACERDLVVRWRSNPDKENAIEHSNGFWVVQRYDDERVVVACYTQLSIGWLKDKWARGVQKQLAVSVRTELEGDDGGEPSAAE